MFCHYCVSSFSLSHSLFALIELQWLTGCKTPGYLLSYSPSLSFLMTGKCFIYAITLKSKKQIPLSRSLNYNQTSLCVLGCTSVGGSVVYMCVCVCVCVCVCSLCLTWCSDQVQCCFTSTETMRSVRDGEPRTAILTFTQLLSSDFSVMFRDRTDYS